MKISIGTIPCKFSNFFGGYEVICDKGNYNIKRRGAKLPDTFSYCVSAAHCDERQIKAFGRGSN